jgi:hypothetical protein
VTVIGKITNAPGEIALYDANGNPVRVKSAGWEHFKKQ